MQKWRNRMWRTHSEWPNLENTGRISWKQRVALTKVRQANDQLRAAIEAQRVAEEAKRAAEKDYQSSTNSIGAGPSGMSGQSASARPQTPEPSEEMREMRRHLPPAPRKCTSNPTYQYRD